MKRTRLVLLDCTSGEAGSAIQWHQSSAFHCYFAHTRAFSLLSHACCVKKELRWLLSNEFNTKSCSYLHIFQIRNSFHCVAKSWWKVSFKATRHGIGVADGAVAKLLRLWQHASALWPHAVWIRIVTSHNAWMGYEYSLPNLNRPRAIH